MVGSGWEGWYDRKGRYRRSQHDELQMGMKLCNMQGVETIKLINHLDGIVRPYSSLGEQPEEYFLELYYDNVLSDMS
ncbi:unnamed protein product [Calypogeia fissa]